MSHFQIGISGDEVKYTVTKEEIKVRYRTMTVKKPLPVDWTWASITADDVSRFLGGR